jgi:hypothetical protein
LQKEADGLRKAVLAREAELHEQQQLAAAAAREAGQQQQRLETKLLKREKRLQEKEARLKAASAVAVANARTYAQQLYAECKRECDIKERQTSAQVALLPIP